MLAHVGLYSTQPTWAPCGHTFPRTQADFYPRPTQHALIVFTVLGCAMAAALWLPNMEFTFALTGATASVLLAYIIPSLCFLRLLAASEALGGGTGSGTGSATGFVAGLLKPGGGAATPGAKPGSGGYGLLGGGGGGGGGHGRLVAPPELCAAWAARRRLALALLVFGVASGVACTHATLSAVSEEKAVVALAQVGVAGWGGEAALGK